jgi:hypothetical protein
MKKTHNNIWCAEYNDLVFTDKLGNCSLCGASLHELTVDEAIALVDRFESVALSRTAAENWRASDWLFDDEAQALAIAVNRVLSSGR